MANVVELLGRPTSVRDARVFIGGTLANDGVEVSVIDVAKLLVSELVTNAVVHARGTIRLTVHTDAQWVQIEVEDQGHGRPVLRPPTKDQRDGRGLQMVDKLATDWGTERRATHKVVWFEIAR
jgi:anti-sigma regulatory factor (Ser/Thr protein kinase)